MKVLSSMRFDRKLLVPEGYELGFKQANAIFHHARVYDGSARKLSFLKPLPASFVSEFNGDLDFLGPDLPPSRAFAIAQGRLDPISMCAFDEFADRKPVSTPHVSMEALSTGSDSHDHPSSRKSMQGDVWLGTDEDLLSFLAASEPELSQSPLFTRDCTFSPLEMPSDKGLRMHFASLSSRKALVQSDVEGPQPPAGNSSIVTLSPGHKRVLASPPNNNPFKRGKGVDEVSKKSSNGQFFFGTKLDGEPSCTGDQFLEDMVRMPEQSSQDAGRSSDARGQDIDGSTVTGKGTIHVKTIGRRSLINNFQGSVHSESATPAAAALFVQRVESQRDIDINVVQVVDLKVSSSAEVDGTFCPEAVKPRYVSGSEAAVPQEKAPLISTVDQDLVEQQISSELCTDSMFLHESGAVASLPMRAGADNSRTHAFKSKVHREAKTKRQIRSSSMQSRKVVMAASEPSLLKFFQRTPTHSFI